MHWSREEDFERNNAFSLYDLYVLTQEPCPWGHEMYNFVEPFLGHHYYTLNLFEPCPRIEKMFSKIPQFYTFCPKITSSWDGVHEIYNVLPKYPKDDIQCTV